MKNNLADSENIRTFAILTKGDHLRFELWYAGEAVDPAAYISF